MINPKEHPHTPRRKHLLEQRKFKQHFHKHTALLKIQNTTYDRYKNYLSQE